MSLELAVKRTIGYAKNFKSHINNVEIQKRLISKKIYPENLIKKEVLKLDWNNKKNKWKKSKITKAKELASLIENKFKDIIFLGISGSVAAGHPKQNDDIDLLIITRSNTLWKNRFFLRWWIYKNKIPHRKFGQKEIKDQFCFNLWLDEGYLKIPKNRQNLKNAIDLILLKPLINKNNSYEKLLLKNNWAKKYVATPYVRLSDGRLVSLSDKIEESNFLKKINNMMYFWPQYWYMRKKFSGEKVSLYQAFFQR